MKRMTTGRLLAAALIAGLGFGGSVSWAQNPTSGYMGPGRYEIENLASGKVMDLNRQDQRTIVQWSRNHTQSQLWDIQDAGNGYVYVKAAATGLAMDIDGGRAREGARVITSQPSGQDSQLWKVEGKGTVWHFTSRLGLVLDLPHGSHDDGVEYATWSGDGRDNQKYRLWWVSPLVAPDHNQYRSDRMPGRMDRDRMDDEKRAYDKGYRSGADDFRAHLRRTFARHRDQYDPQWEVAFIEGYYDGYDAARPETNVMRDEERGLYDDAYRLGQKDYRDGREPNYGRYTDRFDPRSEPFFRRGYYDGYYSSR